MINSNCLYNHDFNSKNNFRDFLKLTQIFSIKIKISMNEKSLFIKKNFVEFYAKKHKIALNIEMIVHKKMRTYIRVRFSSLFINIKIFISRVVFKIKRDLQNEILKFKTRWYVRDFEQSYDINFHETYVFVVKFMSYKVLFVIVAKKNLNAKQMNIIIVFLNFMLKKWIYIWSFENYEKANWIWLFRRVLYKLKQFFKK